MLWLWQLLKRKPGYYSCRVLRNLYKVFTASNVKGGFIGSAFLSALPHLLAEPQPLSPASEIRGYKDSCTVPTEGTLPVGTGMGSWGVSLQPHPALSLAPQLSPVLRSTVCLEGALP